ncbi:7-cyano-7-deazaguanine synthase QueC [Candidatus Latescibacterota bacterium]
MEREHSVTEKKPAIVLLSGGLDSATALAVCIEDGYQPYALSFNYGQRHAHELVAARRIAETMQVTKHTILDIDLRTIGGSALTDTIDVPKNRDDHEMSGEIPVTYVPARNTVFLSIALGCAEVINATDIYIGVNAVDFSGYPDCRPEFIAAFENLANLATKAGAEGSRYSIHAPLIELTKAEIILQGYRLGVDYSLTHSCYDPSPDGLACGSCDSCQLRRKGFTDSGVDDPTEYVKDTIQY